MATLPQVAHFRIRHDWLLVRSGVLGLLLFADWPVHATSAFSFLSSTQTTPAASPLYQLPDPAGSLSFAQVCQRPLEQWQRVAAANFGIDGGAGWACTSLYSTHRQTMWLELPTHLIDSVNVWLVSDGGYVKEYPPRGFGQLADPTYNPVLHPYFLFELPLEARQTYRIYIRGYVVPGLALKFGVRLWEPLQFLHVSRQFNWGWSAFVSFMFIAIGMAILGFLFRPRLIYLYYAGYVACLTLYALASDGWSIFFPTFIFRQLNSISMGYFLIVGLCFFVLFSRQFLAVPMAAPRRWLCVNPWWLGLPATVCLGVSQYGYAVRATALIRVGYVGALGAGLLVAALSVSYWVYALRRGFRPARLRLFFQTGVFIFYLIHVFVVHIGAWKQALPDMLVFQLALVAELILISVGWIYRQKTVRNAYRALQQEQVRQCEAVWEAQRQQQAQEIKTLRLQQELQTQRERLARDLHDGIGSQLTHISTRLDLMSEQPGNPSQLAALSDFTRETSQMLRETIWVLNQESLSLHSYGQRLGGWLARMGDGCSGPQLRLELADADTVVLPPQVASALFRITQEATTNALKYAQAQHMKLQLSSDDSGILFSIHDDGIGFEPTAIVRGYGLTNMQKRTEELGGTFSLQTSPHGTTIALRVPLAAKNS